MEQLKNDFQNVISHPHHQEPFIFTQFRAPPIQATDSNTAPGFILQRCRIDTLPFSVKVEKH